MEDSIALSQEVLVAARTGSPDLDRRLPLLAACDPAALPGDAARIAFWVNVYNALVRRATVGMRGDLRLHRGFFHRTAWEIGGRRCSLHVIEHGLLRVNRPAPFTFWRPLRAGDPRLAWAPSRLDPRVHFALNCGALSCPPVRAYDPAHLDAQLELATGGYLGQEVAIEGDTVRLPYLCRLYARDFEDPRAFVARYVEGVGDRRIRWGPYRWEIVTE